MDDVRIEAPFAAVYPLPFRVILLGGLGILCWATNLDALSKFGVDVAGALELRAHDVGFLSSPRLTISPRVQGDARALARAVYRLFFAYSVITVVEWILFRACTGDNLDYVDSCKFIPAASMMAIAIGALLPLAILEKRVRDQALKALHRCCFSPVTIPISFSDVLLADIMTSFAKVIGDVWLSFCMFLPGGSLLIFPAQNGLSGLMVPFLMSVPYAIRLRQCIIEYLQPTNSSRRPLFNALKYATSFPVIFLSAAQRTVANDIALERGPKAASDPWHGEHPLFRLWLLSVAVNSLYSFWWDVTNDWGLELLRPKAPSSQRKALRQLVLPTLHSRGSSLEAAGIHARHPSTATKQEIGDGLSGTTSPLSPQSPVQHPLPSKLRKYPWGLRQTLLYPLPLYPIAIVLNLVLRFTWSAKLSSHLHQSDKDAESGFYVHGAVVIFWIEVAELLRRWMWVFFRVEWECVKKREQEREFAPEIGDLEIETLGGGAEASQSKDGLGLSLGLTENDVKTAGTEFP